MATMSVTFGVSLTKKGTFTTLRTHWLMSRTNSGFCQQKEDILSYWSHDHQGLQYHTQDDIHLMFTSECTAQDSQVCQLVTHLHNCAYQTTLASVCRNNIGANLSLLGAE